MVKRLISIFFTLAFVLSLVSISGGFDNDPNWIDPNDKGKGQKEYTGEKAMQGEYFGGHDTITAEGMLLKKRVHKSDADAETKFNTFANEALESFRMGAHDEDSTKVAGIPLDDPPIGNTGWGGWWSHFYNPKTGKGLKGFGTPAPERAEDYIKEIKKMAGCTPGGFNNLSPADKNKAYQYFGKSLHLLQDMAVPSHTQDDIHVSQKPFEKHVSEQWDQVVNSQSFKDNVTADKYLSGNYKFTDISQYWKSLAEISSTYPSDEALYEYYRDPLSGAEWYNLNEEKLQKNIDALVPKAIMYSGGFIDSIYDYLTGQSGDPSRCQIEEYFTNPGGDHPDDRFDVSNEFYWEKEYGFSEADLAGLYMRTAMKKGKIGVWYWKRFMEFYTSAVTQNQSAPQEVRDALESEFKAIGQKLDERSNYAESDWKGAPDIALFAYGFYKPSISLLLKYKEPVAFMGLDFNPQIVKDHPVMVIPSGGLYGLENSSMLKAQLVEYVKNGGTLIVFAQQHGYEFSALPVPQEADGTYKTITGYGWTEDQSCLWNGTYIDTYHQMLSAISTSTVSANVDGYFTSYPSNSTILLRRTANGQPAMLMYDYGQGRVIVSSMFSDWGHAHSQATQDNFFI